MSTFITAPFGFYAVDIFDPKEPRIPILAWRITVLEGSGHVDVRAVGINGAIEGELPIYGPDGKGLDE